MDFAIPNECLEELDRFKAFLEEHIKPSLPQWSSEAQIPRDFYSALGRGGWFGFQDRDGVLAKRSALRGALLSEELARVSPGAAVAALAHNDLGLTGLWLFGSDELKKRFGPGAVQGEILMCVGNSEPGAGSDVAGIVSRAERADGGWILNGTKAYVTNGLLADLAVVTAVSDPHAHRNRRISMFLVDLSSEGAERKKLMKQVWIPSDLTRIRLKNVFVPENGLLGERGRGLQQMLAVFTHSRVSISGLTLGTAAGAFEAALQHARKRSVSSHKIYEFQAKAFEMADLYAKIESARLMLLKACWTADRGQDFRLESSLAKYLAVSTARKVAAWAADLFGAASVIQDHPIYKFPMDAWAASLGEGTQDVQKLVIFRELMKRT